MLPEKTGKIKLIRKTATVCDFRNGQHSVFQHPFRVTQPRFNQELVRRTARHFPEHPPEMGIRYRQTPRLIFKMPVQQRLFGYFLPQQMQFPFAEGVDFQPRCN